MVVSKAAYTHHLPSNNEHDIQQTTALAIVRTSAPRETPSALKLSATAVVESERTLPLLLGPTGFPSLLFVSTESPSQLLACRFKNFFPETLVTFLLRLLSHQITRYTFITFLCLAKDTCHPYLDNETSYYLGDTEWFDDPLHSWVGFSLVTTVVDVIRNVMNPGFY